MQVLLNHSLPPATTLHKECPCNNLSITTLIDHCLDLSQVFIKLFILNLNLVLSSHRSKSNHLFANKKAKQRAKQDLSLNSLHIRSVLLEVVQIIPFTVLKSNGFKWWYSVKIMPVVASEMINRGLILRTGQQNDCKIPAFILYFAKFAGLKWTQGFLRRDFT